MQTFFIFFLIILFMSFFWASILAYWFWWTRPPAIQPHEEITDIEYTINDTNEGDTVKVRVYLNTLTWRSKLWENDTLRVNGILLSAKYYNSWLSVGYEYSQMIPRASEYILTLKREWKKEITKIIKASSFWASIPPQIYQNRVNRIPVTSEVPFPWEKVYISISSLTRAPIATDSRWYTHTESHIYGKVIDNTLILTPEDLKHLLPWSMKVTLDNIIKQADGTYVIWREATIELVKGIVNL